MNVQFRGKKGCRPALTPASKPMKPSARFAVWIGASSSVNPVDIKAEAAGIDNVDAMVYVLVTKV